MENRTETQRQADATAQDRQTMLDHHAAMKVAAKTNTPTPLSLFLQKLRIHGILSEGQAPEEMFLTLLLEYQHNLCDADEDICDGSGSRRYTGFTDTGFAGPGDPYGIKEYTDQSPHPDAPQNKVGPDGKTD